jgi:hypothetical protein
MIFWGASRRYATRSFMEMGMDVDSQWHGDDGLSFGRSPPLGDAASSPVHLDSAAT